jgi:hypothetical protein
MSTYTISGSGSLIIASFCVTISSRLYSYYIRRRYLLYIYGGLLVLVPGSVSVRGFIGIWSGDNASALEFTLLMLTNCICLAMGVFLGQIPRKRWILWRRQKLMDCCRSLYGFFLAVCCCRCCSSLGCERTHCGCLKSSKLPFFALSHTHVSLNDHRDETTTSADAATTSTSGHRHYSVDSKHFSSQRSIEITELGMTSSLDALQQQEQLQEEVVTSAFHSSRQEESSEKEKEFEESIVDLEDGRERGDSHSPPE